MSLDVSYHYKITHWPTVTENWKRNSNFKYRFKRTDRLANIIPASLWMQGSCYKHMLALSILKYLRTDLLTTKMTVLIWQYLSAIQYSFQDTFQNTQINIPLCPICPVRSNYRINNRFTIHASLLSQIILLTLSIGCY